MDLDEWFLYACWGVLAFVMVLSLGGCIGKFTERKAVQREAAKAGAARYVLDRETGRPRFEWVTNCVEVGK